MSRAPFQSAARRLGAPVRLVFVLLLVLGILPLYRTLAPQTAHAAPPTDLFFSEYIEGSSNNKALEIYNGTGAAINLATGSYRIQMYFNGSSTPGAASFDLTGTVADGDVYVVAHGSANATILAQADQVSPTAAGWYNGDDAIALLHNGVIIDVIGQIGVDPGSEWGTGLTSTADNTLTRNDTVCGGDPDGTNAFDPSVQWTGYATDTFSYLGSYTASCGSADTAPTVSGVTPANGATDVPLDSNLTISFSEAVTPSGDWVTVDCTSSGSRVPADFNITGGPQNFTLDPATNFAYGDVCTITIHAALVADQDTNDPPDAMAANYTSSFYPLASNPCTDPYTAIYDIQGSGAASPLVGNIVTTMGIVTADFQNTSERSGFFLQEPSSDGNPATSDGVFVFNTSFAVNTGDLVRLRGRVSEYYNLTEIGSVTSVLTCATAQSLGSTTVHLPVPDSMTAADFWEQYEGMLVTIPETLTVAQSYNLGRYGQVMLSTERLYQFTHTDAPDVAGYTDFLEYVARHSIILDDHSGAQNPTPVIHPAPELTFTNTLRGGDLTAAALTGVVNYTFDDWVIDALASVPFTHANPRPSTTPNVGGTLRVVGTNLLNYFTTIDRGTGFWICGPSGDMECRGADSDAEFTRQRAKALNALATLDADVYGLVEIENNETASLQDLVDGLNAMLGAGTYAYIDTGTIGTDAIKTGLIYKPGSVTPMGNFAILDSSVDPAFNSDANRPALAQTFQDNATGELFTVVVNHLKSKGSACSGDPDLGDGQGNCNVTRTQAVKALVNWLNSDPTGSGDSDFLLLGDMNSYSKEDPIRAFEKGSFTNLVKAFGGREAYSYVFDGQWGYLDYALASKSLVSQVTGVGEWHINTDEPTAMDYNDYNQAYLYDPAPIRVSDHDPVVVGLKLKARSEDGGTSNPAGNPDTGIFDPAMSKIGELPAGGIGLPGEQLTWVITVTNRGTGTGTNLVITDTLRSELRIDSVDTPRGSASVAGQIVTFTIPSLAPGESLVLRIITTVLESPLDGVITNTVSLSGQAPDGATATAMAQGIVSTIGSLPSTGYPPAEKTSHPQPALWMLLALVLVALAGGWALRKATK